MMLQNSPSCGLHQRFSSSSEGERTGNSSATSLMFGHLVRAVGKSLELIKVILGITCHEIFSFGKRPYRDVKPKLGKGKEALAEFLRNKKTMDAPKQYFPMGVDNDHVQVMFQNIIK